MLNEKMMDWEVLSVKEDATTGHLIFLLKHPTVDFKMLVLPWEMRGNLSGQEADVDEIGYFVSGSQQRRMYEVFRNATPPYKPLKIEINRSHPYHHAIDQG